MGGELHDKVVEVLGREIAGGVHPPGTVLRTEEAEQRFGISRSVAREVMRTLASMRLVFGRKRVGNVVRPRAEWNLFDPVLIRWLLQVDRIKQLRTLAELRTSVEPAAAGAAAERASDADAAKLVSLAERMVATARAGDLLSFTDADVAFHRLVLSASGNEMFAQLQQVVEEVLRWRVGQGLMPERPRPVALRLHCEIAECIRCGDRARAEEAMRELVAEALEGTLAGLRAASQ
ncbi:FadR/GntR family transcriptional regulator [Saccharopolyspora rectivirgula]|jgi:DNA-binding FadR family transcriptional regulator|uniref:Transcriptional regulator n=1 Tax=Saccharopolyspora rectivirgula TaxID=28042 RepID=A0A073AZM0_9PSEU|nr:FCD domain-containing protein [Saccharopolyspora rectivirgula]KEI44497.1 transcriptional regulator [Saccharopolyspora rectivirgula]